MRDYISNYIECYIRDNQNSPSLDEVKNFCLAKFTDWEYDLYRQYEKDMRQISDDLAKSSQDLKYQQLREISKLYEEYSSLVSKAMTNLHKERISHDRIQHERNPKKIIAKN